MSTAVSIAIQSTDQPQEPFTNGNPSYWPRDILEAYKRGRGPYTVIMTAPTLEAWLAALLKESTGAAS